MASVTRGMRKQIAEATLKAIENGSYILNDVTYPPPSSINDTQFYKPSELSQLHLHLRATSHAALQKTQVSILEISIIQAAQLLSKPDSKAIASGGAAPMSDLGILNFASAKNPGGGFLGVSSLLLLANSIPRIRKTDSGYYSHAMIFSPHVTVFRKDSGALIKPFQVSVVTSPAVNAGVARQREENSETEKKIESVMKERMARILFLFESRGISKLVLGSFGTGGFQNSVPMVARLWAELLGIPGSRFAFPFETVVFGIIGRQTYEEFGGNL